MATRFAITLGLLTASLAIAGCSQEDYYCDEPGPTASCYLCDGLGCRGIAPPARPACECDNHCSAGSCTSLGCTQACSRNADCPRGTICGSTGWCIHPAEGAPSSTSLECVCATSEDCDEFERPGDELSCIDGSCVPTVTPTCDTTHPCSGGRICVEGECRTQEDVCRFSSECGAGRICVNQRCTVGCDASTPCATGAVCDPGGFCVEQPGTGACTSNEQCGSGQICVDGTCWDGCTSDAQCGSGRYCGTDGRCRVDDRPMPGCGPGIASCAPGAVCVNGVCRSPCETSTDCRRFDEQLTTCASDRLCYTTNEATSDCSAAEDCRSGQSCIDGVCR